MIETILLVLAVFHTTLLAVVAILAVAGPRPNLASAALSALAERFVIAYCRAYVPPMPDDEEQVDLTRWIGRCS